MPTSPRAHRFPPLVGVALTLLLLLACCAGSAVWWLAKFAGVMPREAG